MGETSVEGFHNICPQIARFRVVRNSGKSTNAGVCEDSGRIVGYLESAGINLHVGVSKEGWRIQ
jgi:hypothetical protein